MTLAITERTKEDLLKEKSAIEAELSRREYVAKPFKISCLSGNLTFQRLDKELTVVAQSGGITGLLMKFSSQTADELSDWLQMVQGAPKAGEHGALKLRKVAFAEEPIPHHIYMFDYKGQRLLSVLDDDKEFYVGRWSGERYAGYADWDDEEVTNIHEITVA